MMWAGVAVVIAALGGQAFWVAHVLGGLREDIRDVRTDLGEDIRGVRTDLGALREEMLRDHGERIARLEERTAG